MRVLTQRLASSAETGGGRRARGAASLYKELTDHQGSQELVHSAPLAVRKPRGEIHNYCQISNLPTKQRGGGDGALDGLARRGDWAPRLKIKKLIKKSRGKTKGVKGKVLES
ncbi:hypothetical protein T484DRAFT_1921811 [Baffinella frigidus]|nr:hypothetical protein T484DRAFT_1921811 [Cryptophyta sp. CCMP2293]